MAFSLRLSSSHKSNSIAKQVYAFTTLALVCAFGAPSFARAQEDPSSAFHCNSGECHVHLSSVGSFQFALLIEGSEELYAFFSRNGDTLTISERLWHDAGSVNRRLFLFLHELAHLELGHTHKGEVHDSVRQEIEADHFALEQMCRLGVSPIEGLHMLEGLQDSLTARGLLAFYPSISARVDSARVLVETASFCPVISNKGEFRIVMVEKSAPIGSSKNS